MQVKGVRAGEGCAVAAFMHRSPCVVCFVHLVAFTPYKCCSIMIIWYVNMTVLMDMY